MKDFERGEVAAFHSLGWSVNRIAEHLKRSWQTVKSCLQPTTKKNQRPTKKQRRIQERRAFLLKQIRRVSTVNGKIRPLFPTARSLVPEVEKHFVRRSSRTICRDLRHVQCRSIVRPRSCSESQEVFGKRKKLAATWLKFPKRLPRLVFVDEVICSTNDHSSRTMWVGPGDTIVRRERKRKSLNNNALHVWGMIGVGMKGIFILNAPSRQIKFPRGRPKKGEVRPEKQKKESFTSETYVTKCLAPNSKRLKRSGSWVYQDGAKCHTAGDTIEWLKKARIPYVKDVPPYSPMFNKIEHVWPLLHEAVDKLAPRNVQELETAILKAFDELPQSKIDHLVLSFASACKKCIETNGRM